MTAPLTVPIQRVRAVPLPQYATAGAAGLDLQAAVADELYLPPLGRALVPTGIAIALPPGYEAQVRPRSGLAVRHGITLLNSPGTVDADYRGEIQVILVNLSDTAFTVTPGMRIAQLVVAQVQVVHWAPTDQLDATARGSGGFGHTGQ